MTLTREIAVWHDATLSPAKRATALLQEMTLREKIQQLVSVWPGAENASSDVAPMQETQDQALPFDEAIVDGVGQLTRPYGTAPIDPADGRARLADLQRSIMAANRFGIPALAHEECLTGFTAWKATVYPTPLAWASTFNPELIAEMGAAIGSDLASAGIHQGLAPVLDVVRDYRWGRVEETLGEDPYLVGELAAAYVRGVQSAGVVATLKHFAGYSASRGARNHAPVSIGRRELADVILIPFEKAVIQAKVRSVMNSYTELDGIPSASDGELLTGLLRDRWGFEGTVVSDYWSIPFLNTMHKIASTNLEAGTLALHAGIDVELPHASGFDVAMVRDAQDTEAVDRAALRVLTQKAELGLLDSNWNPSTDALAIDLDSIRNKDIARRVAEESIVLLRNHDSALPITSAPRRIAVVGPGADDAHCLFGCYSFPNHVIPNHPDAGIGVVAPTITEAIEREFPGALVNDWTPSPSPAAAEDNIDQSAQRARDADLTILVVGDRSGMFGHGTSGEGCDATTLDLPHNQSELINAVLDASSNVILVVLSGRPYEIGDFASRAQATIQTFFPGQEGAAAVAGVISGRLDPQGRLPVQIPGSASSQPSTYLAPPLALKSDGVSNVDPTPAFPFGFGLSYTEFSVGPLRPSSLSIPTDGTVTVQATVRNSGTRRGTWVGQLYLSDPVASVTRPVRQLIGFCRMALEPQQEAEVSFVVHADLTSFTGRSLERHVESGEIILTLGESAADPGSACSVNLVGPTRIVDHTRILSSAARIA